MTDRKNDQQTKLPKHKMTDKIFKQTKLSTDIIEEEMQTKQPRNKTKSPIDKVTDQKMTDNIFLDKMTNIYNNLQTK